MIALVCDIYDKAGSVLHVGPVGFAIFDSKLCQSHDHIEMPRRFVRQSRLNSTFPVKLSQEVLIFISINCF